MTSILSLLGLSKRQEEATLARHPAIAVTAGAGSGKTRTLAGRYLGLVEQGLSLRSLVAITFTDKAAREMRNRIRATIGQWRNQVAPGPDATLWERAFNELDAARIGTIHSLCAEILRAHPAEADIDPLFVVLEENTAALLRARAVEEALAWAMDDTACSRLFGPLSEHRLRQTVATLLGNRLDAAAAFAALADEPLEHWSAALGRWLAQRLEAATWQQALADLAAVRARKPDDKMELSRLEVLARWDAVCAVQQDGDWQAALIELAVLRKAINARGGAKGNWDAGELDSARQAMAALRSHYDQQIKPLTDKSPSWTLDEQMAALLRPLQRLFERSVAIYEAMKAPRQALDFDDLEARAARLLVENQAVRRRWQAEVAAVLVDEFQDTNERQRQIVYALTGFGERTGLSSGASLFVVGDGKQSIYRFRGADVTVFRRVQADVKQAGGLLVALDTTYRSHRPLVQALNALLAPILGTEDDPQQPFRVPFAALKAFRPEPELPAQPPFLEFHLGLGEDANQGRAAAAAGLAARLHQLHEQGFAWGDMALLFRASSSFAAYEDALERAGIPFVTVAGRGFYDRPEIRDLLNALAAIADPTDDLALAGLLRSPMFGLSDAALYQLRWDAADGGRPARHGFWAALHTPAAVDELEASDAAQARRAAQIVEQLHGLAGRTTVAEVLKRLLDETHYRAALRLAPGGQRAWRNVDKLLADAHRSGLVGVGEFLEYVQSLRDVAAREGEAPSEAGQAVQLMTIHKAKGLEFPVVVLADAAYKRPAFTPPLLLDPDLGPLLNIDDPDGDNARPVAYQLALLHQQAMDEAEEQRLLYVAATRARELLLISGHARLSTGKRDPGRLILTGWLKKLAQEVGLHEIRLPELPTEPQALELPWEDGAAVCVLYPASEPAAAALVAEASLPQETSQAMPASLPALDLADPLPGYEPLDAIDDKTRERESDPPPRVWRVVPRARRPRGPAWVVGTLVHEALRRWRFPDQPGFDAFLRPIAVESGLSDPAEIAGAIAEARRLLARFQAHPLYAELEQAERHHELPYSLELDGKVASGVVDLLARPAPGARWRLYDFKTDRLAAGVDLRAFAREQGYDQQVLTYAAALAQLLGQRPSAQIVFLNVGGKVRLLDL